MKETANFKTKFGRFFGEPHLRNFAARLQQTAFSSQGEETPVLAFGTCMSIACDMCLNGRQTFCTDCARSFPNCPSGAHQ
ncbi:predicted protein [Botrytis cinerea T4]|uniref:Uncharacterized protein n=1 Tax=Botryotinia fuckeliana (strain T4) TaxID=999810 RepID=G2XTP0_BOTF4|nr:predicted protein [Botrytis cinerea T4]